MGQILELDQRTISGAHDVQMDVFQPRQRECKPMPVFTDTELDVVQAYWDGKQITEIVVPTLTQNMVRKTILDSGRLSIRQRIFHATGNTWIPTGSAEMALWMYKHAILPPLPIEIDTQIHRVQPFNDTSIMVARFFLAGYTSSKQLWSIFSGHLSESVIRNIFNGSRYSIASTIHWWTEGAYFPSHKLAACRWMVERGLIPESVIGEALP